MEDLELIDRLKLAFPSSEELALAFAFDALPPLASIVVFAGVVALALLLSCKLSGIDLRDKAAAADYVLFVTTAGAALLIAVPGMAGARLTPFAQALVIAALMAIAGLRWQAGRPKRFTPTTTDRTEKPQSKGARP